jgi:hypothetical protein
MIMNQYAYTNLHRKTLFGNIGFHLLHPEDQFLIKQERRILFDEAYNEMAYEFQRSRMRVDKPIPMCIPPPRKTYA